jgi:uncharacterized alpha-E superfamily protein
VISRVAESCYWLMRYVERCDTTARLLLIQSGMVLDMVLPAHRQWRPLLIVSGEEGSFEERFGRKAVADGERVREYLTWDDGNPVSVLRCVDAARENARTIRETISLEMWNSLNAFWLWLREAETRKLHAAEPQEFYDQVNHRCHVFHGITQKTMLREEPFDFMSLGMFLERAGQTARILDIHHHAIQGQSRVPTEVIGVAEWISILRTRHAYEPFFKKRGGALDGPAVAEFLISEPGFPSSVAFALTRAQEALERIRSEGSPIGRRSAELLNTLRSAVTALDVSRVVDTDVHDTLTRIVDHCSEVSQAIGEEYFYSVTPRPAESEVIEA